MGKQRPPTGPFFAVDSNGQAWEQAVLPLPLDQSKPAAAGSYNEDSGQNKPKRATKKAHK